MPADIPPGGALTAPPASPPPMDPPSDPRAARANAARIHLDELHALSTASSVERMQALRIRIHPDRTRHQLVADILRFLTERGSEVCVDGVLDMASESHGFLRWPRFSFRPGPEDIYVPSRVVRRFGLQSGHRLAGRVRPARDREKFLALDEVSIPSRASRPPPGAIPKPFDSLTATFPTERIILENPVTRSIIAAGHRSHHPAGPRPARPHRRPAAHRQDHPPQGDRPGHPRQFPGNPRHPAPRR